MTAYGNLSTEFYDRDKPTAPAGALAFYLEQARNAGGRILEPMCGSGRFLLPLSQAGLPIDGVDSSPSMLNACRVHASRLGVDVNIYLQELTALELPHRYSMAFVPSGSIGLLTEDDGLRSALSRLHSHLEPGGVLFLELEVDDGMLTAETELEPRNVSCSDGSSIIYTSSVSRLAGADMICFSGTYRKFNGSRVIATEKETLLLRLYDPEQVLAQLSACGFKLARVYDASERSFLTGSGCLLIEASADA